MAAFVEISSFSGIVYKTIVKLVAFTKFWEIIKNVIEEAKNTSAINNAWTRIL